MSRATDLAKFLMAGSILLLYLAPFWWPGGGNSWVAMMRVFVAISSIIVLVNIYNKKSYVFSCCRQPLVAICLLLFLYLLFNAVYLSDGTKVYRRLALLVLFLLSFGFFQWSDAAVRRVAVVIGVAGFLFAAYSLLNKYFIDELPLGYRKRGIFESGMPGIADFGNTIVAAMHFSISLILLSFLLFTEMRKRLIPVWLVMALVVGVYITFTFARSGWVISLVGCGLIFLQTFRRASLVHYFVAACIFTVFIYFAFTYFGYELYGRGLTRRDEIWAAVINSMHGFWLLGHGLMTPIEPVLLTSGQIVHNTHSVYLEVLFQTGVVGLFIYLMLVAVLVWTLVKAKQLAAYKEGSILMLSAVIAVSVAMLTELNSWIHTPNLIWQWLWVPVGYALGVSSLISKEIST